MTSKNILAYFKTPEQAEGAASKLRAMRAEAVSVDRFDKFPEDTYDRYSNMLSGDFPGLAATVLDTEDTGDSSKVMMAADPSASGMSAGDGASVTGTDILLTAVVDESIHHQALRVVREAGGNV